MRLSSETNLILSKKNKLLSENIIVINGKNKAREKSSRKIKKNINVKIKKNLIFSFFFKLK